ncbi:MAG: hypothetical protein IIB40_08640 [Candidatus Marinimicrobia bacterium]|nr:hypothetical protein [Candidatus Neomarinimicrobiota bacterium]
MQSELIFESETPFEREDAVGASPNSHIELSGLKKSLFSTPNHHNFRR